MIRTDSVEELGASRDVLGGSGRVPGGGRVPGAQRSC